MKSYFWKEDKKVIREEVKFHFMEHRNIIWLVTKHNYLEKFTKKCSYNPFTMIHAICPLIW